MVITHPSQIPFQLEDVPTLPMPKNVLMTSPQHFSVDYVINPHMAGNVGKVQFKEAVQQWEELRQTYSFLGFEPDTLEGVTGLPDMVFCANQCLPYFNPADSTKGIFLSEMHAEQRKDEVQYYREFFRRRGYQIQTMPESVEDFEGMGDALWHPARYLLWGGFGFRSSIAAYEYISETIGVDVIALELLDSDFYHLDTCLSMLTENSCLAYPGAFNEDGWELISTLFDTVIESPENEARDLFSVNAHCHDGRHVIIQNGCTTTAKRLEQHGFEPIFVETGEFLKSGGSVFCMKQVFW